MTVSDTLVGAAAQPTARVLLAIAEYGNNATTTRARAANERGPSQSATAVALTSSARMTGAVRSALSLHLRSRTLDHKRH